MIARRLSRFVRPFAFLAAFAAAGCNDAAPTPTDPAVAKQHLTTALDAWKSGGARADLVQKSPPLHVLDRDWDKGAKITDYALVGEGQVLGAGVQWPVSLTLTNEKGKTIKKKVTYVVNAGDVVAIARQDADF